MKGMIENTSRFGEVAFLAMTLTVACSGQKPPPVGHGGQGGQGGDWQDTGGSPSGGSTAIPSGGSTATPSGGSTATPSGGSTATPSGGFTATGGDGAASAGITSSGGINSAGSAGSESGGMQAAGGSAGEAGSVEPNVSCEARIHVSLPQAVDSTLTVEPGQMWFTSDAEVVPGPVSVHVARGPSTAYAQSWCPSGDPQCIGCTEPPGACPEPLPQPLPASAMRPGTWSEFFPPEARNVRASCGGSPCDFTESRGIDGAYSLSFRLQASSAPSELSLRFDYDAPAGTTCEFLMPARGPRYDCQLRRAAQPIDSPPFLEKELVATAQGPVLAFSVAPTPPREFFMPQNDLSFARLSYTGQLEAQIPLPPSNKLAVAWVRDHLASVAEGYVESEVNAFSLDGTKLSTWPLSTSREGLPGPTELIAFGHGYAAALGFGAMIMSGQWLSVQTSDPQNSMLLRIAGPYSSAARPGVSLAALGERLIVSTTARPDMNDPPQSPPPGLCSYWVFEGSTQIGRLELAEDCAPEQWLLERGEHVLLLQRQSDGLKVAALNGVAELSTPLLLVTRETTLYPTWVDAGPGLAGLLWSDGLLGQFVLVDTERLEATSNQLSFAASSGSPVSKPVGVFDAGNVLIVFEREGSADSLALNCTPLEGASEL